MKKSLPTFVAIGLTALITGIGLGYFLFGKNQADTPSTSQHTAEGIEYTCAMHPQIRQKEPGICPLCQMELTPAGQTNQDQPIQLTMSAEALRLAQIETTRVGVGISAEKQIHLSGKIAPDERLSMAQTAHIAGRIERLFTTFTGERVRKGQVIATIYAPALVTAQREFLEALRIKNTNPNLLEAARIRLRNWKLPESFIEDLEKSGKIQREVQIIADRGGIITARKISVGDYVEEGEVLFELMDLNKVWALLEAYERDLPHLPVGSTVRITTPAAPGRSFNARITFIDPLLDQESRTVALRAELDNSSGLFKPGMFVEADAQAIRSPGSTLYIPKTAVLWTGKRSVVYVRQPDTTVPTFEFREIETGSYSEESVQVLSGLEIGEEIVTQGVFSLDAAAQLNNQQSMMNRMVQTASATTRIPAFTDELPSSFYHDWNQILNTYLSLKDYLVQSNPAKTAQQASQLLQALQTVATQNLPSDFQDWWQPRSGNLKARVQKIAASRSIQAQRKEFLGLSEAIIQMVPAISHAAESLYVQHCPMAFNNQGGDWISAQREIRNPYFGEEMLQCGVVRDSFP